MLEIYNEKVHDLFLPPEKRIPGGIKIRESPNLGFYPEGLVKAIVKNYEDIEKWMETGSKHRSIAATQMNATSSRAHTIFIIEFTQKYVVGE